LYHAVSVASRLKYKVQSLFLVKAIVGSARSSFRASSRSRHNIAEHLSWDGWSNRAGKVAYESRRDYIIAVKGKMRLRVTQSESAAFRRISLISSSGDLWCGVVHDGVIRPFGGVGNGTRGCGYWLGGV